MKIVKLHPLVNPVNAEVDIPGSKSYTNRALFLAAMTPGSVKIVNPLLSDDTLAMLNCLNQLGLQINYHKGSIVIKGDVSTIKNDDYDLNTDISGTTMRFMTSLCAVLPGRQTLRGGEGLYKRPIGDLVKALRKIGAQIDYLQKEGFPPLLISRPVFTSNIVYSEGSESSQYISALLMVAPLIGGLTIKVKGELISRPYVDMTLEAMRQFNVIVEHSDNVYKVPTKTYKALKYEVEGDFSSASYFAAIAALTSSTLQLNNLNISSRQADRRFFKLLESMGSRLIYGNNKITIEGKGVMPVEVNMQDYPDQAQTLAAMAAFAKGPTTISGIQSLRVKETERVKALQNELQKMKVKSSATHDSLQIYGGRPTAAKIKTYGDHRMAMSFAVAGSKLSGLQIEEPSVVTKTFPGFWQKLADIGVKQEWPGRNLVLIGMRGSGKTTVANLLAKELNHGLVDLDTIMTERLSLTTPQIVAKHGWQYFRDQEALITMEVSQLNSHLISTGGGVVLKPSNVQALKSNGLLVYLRTSVNKLVNRLESHNERPPLTDAVGLDAEIKQVLAERQILYEAAADIIIDTDDLAPVEVAAKIINLVQAGKA